jgi:uncharacterized protein YbjT (DUF2867 family)
VRIAIAGGTGTVGSLTAAEAERRGHEVVVMARSRGVDLVSGTGVADALAGAEVVIDLASVATLAAGASRRFFRTATGNLLAAAATAGVPHVVALSIVGIDSNPRGYYAGKLAQEEVVITGPVPWTLLRTTQFHEFAGQIAARARFGPLQLAPHARVQPVAAALVAERLVDLAEGEPAGRVRDLGGPREEDLADLIAQWVRRRGGSRRVLPVNLPTGQMRSMRQGTVLPGADAELAGPTFGQWLAAQP